MISSSPARRRRIISDQKKPSDPIPQLYRLATKPIAEFMAAGANDESIVDRAVLRLRASSGTKWAMDDARNTADALEEFLQVANGLPPEEVRYERGPDQAPHLRIKSVDISVCPNLLLFSEQRGVPCVGALKLHFPKSDERALGREGGEYVATLLLHWLAEYGPRGVKVLPSLCLSVDIFRRSIVHAPAATLRRMASVAAACEEIAAHWERLDPAT
ncbi:hypothetical protein [Piscinibacter defluvii]|uniref:hypothetical protein n=1 Tax=Piscinibacter defluvii TaxID=1796922 RepID=UPI000FDEDF36|nr:hypothetical protein [Piscinibacter defluvii]